MCCVCYKKLDCKQWHRNSHIETVAGPALIYTSITPFLHARDAQVVRHSKSSVALVRNRNSGKGLATRDYVISSSPSAQRSWLEFVKECSSCYSPAQVSQVRMHAHEINPPCWPALGTDIDPLYCTGQGMRVVHTDCGIMTYFDPFSFLSSLTPFTE